MIRASRAEAVLEDAARAESVLEDANRATDDFREDAIRVAEVTKFGPDDGRNFIKGVLWNFTSAPNLGQGEARRHIAVGGDLRINFHRLARATHNNAQYSGDKHEDVSRRVSAL